MNSARPKLTPTLGEPSEAPSGPRTLQGALLGGRWRLLSPIGAGGMGEVWRARHDALGREVAVKLLTAPSAANRTRMLREAQILASLRHDAIVEVFDIGDHQDVPYFVMGWVDGETLAERLDRDGPLPAREAARAFVPLLDGLAAAHRAGVIHRDLKPDNILVTLGSDGMTRLVLIDFGIAQLSGPESRLTATGALVGTPEYMSPEVLRGGEADERADVWGAAATLYEVLTGTSPFRRDHFVATVRAVVEDEPAPIGGTTPRALALVVERGLAKSVEARHPSAGAMRDALEAFLSGAVSPAERGLARTQPAPRNAAAPAPPSARGASSLQPVHSVGASSSPPSSLDALIRERFGRS